MANKCDICGEKIEETFLKKIIGIAIRVNGKDKYVCSSCQKQLKTKEKILEKLK